MHKHPILLAVLLFSLCSAPQAFSQTFRYQAYLAGTKAGTAIVHVEISDKTYHLSGSAKAQGILKWFGKWRSRFEVKGRIDGDELFLDEYRYVEREERKRRELSVRDGVLRVVKNGKPRRPRKALPGTDILTGLFVNPRCHDEQLLHTGRHNYQLRRLDLPNETTGTSRCRYEIHDDDGDRYVASVEFAQLGDLTVPVKMTFGGFIRGRMELVEP